MLQRCERASRNTLSICKTTGRRRNATATTAASDDACFAGARLFVDTQEALQKSGELLGPMSRGVFGVDDVVEELADLAAGQIQGRAESDGRTVFKAVGTALEDLAAAVVVYEASDSTETLALAGR